MNIFKMMNWTLFLGILGGLIVIFATVAQWNEKKIEESKAEINQKKVDSVSKELKELQSKSLEKTEELADAYKQIANLQKEIKNQITGGNSIPYLKLHASELLNDKRTGQKYFIIYFALELKGEYNLQNVRCTIYDISSAIMQNYGVSYTQNGLSTMSSTKKGIENYQPVKRFDLGTLTIDTPRQIHIATLHPTESVSDFTVEINWNNGSLTHFIDLKVENSEVKIKNINSVFDGKKTKEYSRFIEFEN